MSNLSYHYVGRIDFVKFSSGCESSSWQIEQMVHTRRCSERGGRRGRWTTREVVREGGAQREVDIEGGGHRGRWTTREVDREGGAQREVDIVGDGRREME